MAYKDTEWSSGTVGTLFWGVCFLHTSTSLISSLSSIPSTVRQPWLIKWYSPGSSFTRIFSTGAISIREGINTEIHSLEKVKVPWLGIPIWRYTACHDVLWSWQKHSIVNLGISTQVQIYCLKHWKRRGNTAACWQCWLDIWIAHIMVNNLKSWRKDKWTGLFPQHSNLQSWFRTRWSPCKSNQHSKQWENDSKGSPGNCHWNLVTLKVVQNMFGNSSLLSVEWTIVGSAISYHFTSAHILKTGMANCWQCDRRRLLWQDCVCITLKSLRDRLYLKFRTWCG